MSLGHPALQSAFLPLPPCPSFCSSWVYAFCLFCSFLCPSVVGVKISWSLKLSWKEHMCGLVFETKRPAFLFFLSFLCFFDWRLCFPEESDDEDEDEESQSKQLKRRSIDSSWSSSALSSIKVRYWTISCRLMADKCVKWNWSRIF